MASNNALTLVAWVAHPPTRKRYEALADAEPDTWFIRQPAAYPCLNMDQVVGRALAACQRIEEALPRHCMNGVVLGGQI